MTVQTGRSHSWWFASQGRLQSSTQSPWLSMTLSELEEKIKKMLNLIEDDGDSFAKRAEMYYKKKPQLVEMIEDFYRAYRSLAELYDQLKSGTAVRRSILVCPSYFEKSWSQSISSSETDAAAKFFSDSEVDNPEKGEEIEAENKSLEMSDEGNTNYLAKLKRELERLEKENAKLSAEIAGKDEEKREVIRQLAYSLNFLKEENATLRKCVKDLEKIFFKKDSEKKGGLFELRKRTKDMLLAKLFRWKSKIQTTVVAL